MDIDFCANHREEVIDYVKSKYGKDHVSQIMAFNTMSAKSVVKDVARALDIPFEESNKISKLITGDTLKASLEESPDFKKFYASSESAKKLIDISLSLEGLVRSCGKHAAGVVISRDPLTDSVPLYQDTKGGGVVSQYEKYTLEAAGLVKMDFLGLKNLTIINCCLDIIKKTRDVAVDIEHLSLEDPETYKLLQNADTKGVFQLESPGMQNILHKLGPTCIDDIIAVVALYRPGPLGSGMVDQFIRCKRHPEEVVYPHPSLEPVLSDTLGVIVYQEQVMLISQVMGGFTLSEADKLRKAMSKKKIDIINQMREKFLEGAHSKKIDASVAEDVYDKMSKFGEYGFNKSHSAAYAIVSYQTAYLKAHYRIEYMAALLSATNGDLDEIVKYVNDARAGGIMVLPPDVNKSDFDFTVEKNAIRFGLNAIKGVGSKAIESIIAGRGQCDDHRFHDAKDFLEHIDISTVNKGVFESLIKSGAFDTVQKNRARMVSGIDIILETAKKMQEDILSGQGNLFGGGTAEEQSAAVVELPNIPDWNEIEKLTFEKEVLGVYLSGHPLARYEKELRAYSCGSIAELKNSRSDGEITVTIVAIIQKAQKRFQKNGKPFAMALLEDMEGSIEALFFSNTFAKYESLIFGSDPVAVTGKVEFEDGMPKKMLVDEVKTLRDARRKAVSAVHIKIDTLGLENATLTKIKNVLEENRGDCPVFFHIETAPKCEKIIRAHSTYNIKPSDKLTDDIMRIAGHDSIRYSLRSC